MGTKGGKERSEEGGAEGSSVLMGCRGTRTVMWGCRQLPHDQVIGQKVRGPTLQSHTAASKGAEEGPVGGADGRRHQESDAGWGNHSKKGAYKLRAGQCGVENSTARD